MIVRHRCDEVRLPATCPPNTSAPSPVPAEIKAALRRRFRPRATMCARLSPARRRNQFAPSNLKSAGERANRRGSTLLFGAQRFGEQALRASCDFCGPSQRAGRIYRLSERHRATNDDHARACSAGSGAVSREAPLINQYLPADSRRRLGAVRVEQCVQSIIVAGFSFSFAGFIICSAANSVNKRGSRRPFEHDLREFIIQLRRDSRAFCGSLRAGCHLRKSGRAFPRCKPCGRRSLANASVLLELFVPINNVVNGKRY